METWTFSFSCRRIHFLSFPFFALRSSRLAFRRHFGMMAVIPSACPFFSGLPRLHSRPSVVRSLPGFFNLRPSALSLLRFFCPPLSHFSAFEPKVGIDGPPHVNGPSCGSPLSFLNRPPSLLSPTI